MVPDRIEREILIDAPLDVVWAVVTEPQHLGAWFGDAASVDLRPGGEAVFTWREHGFTNARVETVDPPHTFAFRWARPLGAELGEGNSTLVELSLRAEGAGTRLRVVESGFRELHGTDEEKERYAEGNREGWREELAELAAYASEVRAPARR
jgi:uncharacterized protein YndB with AHSA1/START domain